METIWIMIPAVVVLCVAMWIRDKDKGELMTDEEEKQVYQEWQMKKDDEDSIS